jgi:hypothetical protein
MSAAGVKPAMNLRLEPSLSTLREPVATLTFAFNLNNLPPLYPKADREPLLPRILVKAALPLLRYPSDTRMPV